MKTNKEHRDPQSGNALVYVLIAIALFAALSFTLSRQTDTGEAGELSDTRAELYATQLISYAAQVKSALDQMKFTGAKIDDLDFIDPSDVNFNSGTQKDRSNRVFHPEGGGLVKGQLPQGAIDSNFHNDPVPGWYLDRFNNVEWTPTNADDVILSAFQIDPQVCAKINEKITGTTTIPIINSAINIYLINETLHSNTNAELTTNPSGTPICPDCHEMRSLCVTNNTQANYAFYTVVLDQ